MRAVLNNMSDAEIEDLLVRAPFGRLGLSDGKIPYIVPVSFVYIKGMIYFHSSSKGKKTEILDRNRNVCFEVDEYENRQNYKSVIVDGIAEEIIDEKEVAKAIMGILDKAKKHGLDQPEKLTQVAGHKGMLAKMDPRILKVFDSTNLSEMIEKMASRFRDMMKIFRIEIKARSGRKTG